MTKAELISRVFESLELCEEGLHFFDSWGNPWVECSPEHPEAEAFGPSGTARRGSFPTYPEAKASGQVVEGTDGWDYYVPSGYEVVATCNCGDPTCKGARWLAPWEISGPIEVLDISPQE